MPATMTKAQAHELGMTLAGLAARNGNLESREGFDGDTLVVEFRFTGAYKDRRWHSFTIDTAGHVCPLY